MLFAGPDSVGKFTAARLLGKGLLCQTTPSGSLMACDACGACHKVNGGHHADLHIVTTDERQLKVDAIRDAERALRLHPVEGDVKVLIVDDAHRMNVQAQNALLKTLEEPPGRTHIVLTTSRPKNLLATVVSRCQRVPFRALNHAVVVNALMSDRGLAEPEAHLLASLAGGSLGSAMNLESEDVLSLRDQVADLDRALAPRSAGGAVRAMNSAAELADDRGRFIEALTLLQVWLHDQLRLAADPGFQVANIDRLDELRHLAHDRGIRAILGRLAAVNETRRQLEMPYNFNGQLLAEQLCLDLAGHGRVEVLDRDY